MRQYITTLWVALAPLTACGADVRFESTFVTPNDNIVDAGVISDGGMAAEASTPNHGFCAKAPPGALCKHEDPTFVAHCVDGQCVPFGCDYCPKPTCRDVFCDEGQCRQQDEPDGTPCVRDSGTKDEIGYLGQCVTGQCAGLTSCNWTDPCPEVGCAAMQCDIKKLCKASWLAAGTQCKMADGMPGLCSNHACIVPGKLP